LLIASEDEPRLCDVARCRALLYELGLEARARVEQKRSESLKALNDFVFGELGFAGNEQDYYDPRNSLLHHVLERRMGIPITLSIVYIDLGRRAGLHVEGVGLPGHFIVRVREDVRSERATLVDPFHATTLDKDDCQQRLDQMYAGQVPLTDEHLRAATTREILVRLLRNLKTIYAQTHLYRHAVSIVERILMLAPQAIEERRDRGMLLAQLNTFHEAIADIEAYLKLAPRASDTEQVREQLKKMQVRLATLN
jgi:regulator of sirC expression with transglutaminase-like and TPR domain